MDILKIIDSAIEDLPVGDHSTGVKAIRRHIVAAIRHFECEDGGVVDSHTDCIYRCNQAFEGGLKEAYRVLAGKDPQKKSPYEIEQYLEDNKVIRQRVLKQLTRYREDYRNPSTHDYRLDFDEDEALLAIVSVCAFTKLLINQISGKIAYNAGVNVRKNQDLGRPPVAATVSGVKEIISNALSQLPDAIRNDYGHLSQYLHGVFESNGLNTESREEEFPVGDEELGWGEVVLGDGLIIPVEFRHIPQCHLEISYEWIRENALKESAGDVFLVISAQGQEPVFNYISKSIDGFKLHIFYPKTLPEKYHSGYKKDFESIISPV